MRTGFVWVARAEGVSYLLLLGVAMPLKYVAGEPLAVEIVGWVHGILFMAYVVALGIVASVEGWGWMRVLGGFVASVLPFGPFVLEQRITEVPTAS